MALIPRNTPDALDRVTRRLVEALADEDCRSVTQELTWLIRQEAQRRGWHVPAPRRVDDLPADADPGAAALQERAHGS
ncbi:MAG: hypothetical protein RLZZ387_2448 [Chloroflexota bacterium]|jgi:hypothetical protein